jgi:hypothetical protein
MELIETMNAAENAAVRRVQEEFGVNDEFVGKMVSYLKYYDSPIVGGGRKGGRKSRRMQRGGGFNEILEKIVAGAHRVQDIVAGILPQTAAATSAAASGVAVSARRAPPAIDSVLARGVRGISGTDAITTLTCLLAITTVYGVGNPYTKLVENALKMVLAVTPDPWTLDIG